MLDNAWTEKVPQPQQAERPKDRFTELLQELAALEARKRKDYGTEADPLANVKASEEWGVAPWIGAMIRLTDKVRRLQQFAKRGSLANESAIDSLRDIAVYSLLALMLLEQERGSGVTKWDQGTESWVKVRG